MLSTNHNSLFTIFEKVRNVSVYFVTDAIEGIYVNLFISILCGTVTNALEKYILLLLLLHLIPTFMWGRCTMTYASV